MRQVGELPSVSIVVHRTTTRGLDRLVNFSDAVVAVAVTLLALPLIDLVEEGDTVSDLFRTRRVEFVTYVLVFLLMILFWIGHHRFWEKVSDYDVTLIWLNALWLLSMSLFPVFAGFDIERGPEDGQAVAYTALLGALFFVRLLMMVHLYRHRDLRAADVDDDDLWVAGEVFLVVSTAVVAGLIATWPAQTKILALFGPILGAYHVLRRRRLQTP